MHYSLWIAIILSLICIIVFLLRYNFWRWPVSYTYPRVLMYHSVSPFRKPSGLNIWPLRLERNIKYLLSKGWTFVFVSELAKYWGKEKIVALTFDDGFANNFEYAFPLFKKYKVKATIYLSPEKKDIEVLNDEQIQTMFKSGLVEFGAHTISHCNLLNISEKEGHKEIEESKHYVEKITGKECTSFAYPYGRYKEASVDSVNKIGFDTAVTTKKNMRLFSLDNLLEIPRLGVSGKANRLQFYIMLSRGRYRV